MRGVARWALLCEPGLIRGGDGPTRRQPFNVTTLDGCEVMLLDHMDQVQVDDVKNSKLFIGTSRALLWELRRAWCAILTPSGIVDRRPVLRVGVHSRLQQLRHHGGVQATPHARLLRLRVLPVSWSNAAQFIWSLRDLSPLAPMSRYSLTDPIIETSTRCQFAPFNGAYPGIADHFRKAYLEPDNNHWKNVFDFNKDEDSDRLPKPHWTLLEESSWTDWHVAVDGVAPDPNPVSKTAAAPAAKAIGGTW